MPLSVKKRFRQQKFDSSCCSNRRMYLSRMPYLYYGHNVTDAQTTAYVPECLGVPKREYSC